MPPLERRVPAHAGARSEYFNLTTGPVESSHSIYALSAPLFESHRSGVRPWFTGASSLTLSTARLPTTPQSEATRAARGLPTPPPLPDRAYLNASSSATPKVREQRDRCILGFCARARESMVPSHRQLRPACINACENATSSQWRLRKHAWILSPTTLADSPSIELALAPAPRRWHRSDAPSHLPLPGPARTGGHRSGFPPQRRVLLPGPPVPGRPLPGRLRRPHVPHARPPRHPLHDRDPRRACTQPPRSLPLRRRPRPRKSSSNRGETHISLTSLPRATPAPPRRRCSPPSTSRRWFGTSQTTRTRTGATASTSRVTRRCSGRA